VEGMHEWRECKSEGSVQVEEGPELDIEMS